MLISHDAMRVSNPATAKATQKELTPLQRCDFGHVPLAEIRIELAGIMLHRKPCQCDVVSANPATAKATQKELTGFHIVDVGHVPLAEIRIELAGIIKRCTGSHANAMVWEQRCAVSNPATAKATQKELTVVQRCDFGHVPLAEIRIELAGIKTLHRKPCGNAMMWEQRHDVVSAIRQQRRQLKKNLLCTTL